MEKGFFEEFLPLSREQWEASLEKTLKGLKTSSLDWTPEKDVSVKPFYVAGEIPGSYSFEKKGGGNTWTVSSEIKWTDPTHSLEQAKHLLRSGAQELTIDLRTDQKDLNSLNQLISDEGFTNFLMGLAKDLNKVSFRINPIGQDIFYEALVKFAEDPAIPTTDFFPGIENDPISEMALSGEIPLEDPFVATASVLKHSAQNYPEFRSVTISSEPVQAAGGSPSLEIASILSSLVDYFERLDKFDLEAGTIISKATFRIPVGTSFFQEIAKLRATRFLLGRLLTKYDIEDFDPLIISPVSRISWSQCDVHTNLLRATTAALSAVAGGANKILIPAFGSEEMASRISMNIQLLLREEAWLDKVNDPGGGSWYIESLTEKIVQKAWENFLEIESKGGWMEVLKVGWVQDKIRTNLAPKLEKIRQGENVLIGINKYKNPETEGSGTVAGPRPSNKDFQALQPIRIEDELALHEA